MKGALNPVKLVLRCRVSQFGGEQSVGCKYSSLDGRMPIEHSNGLCTKRARFLHNLKYVLELMHISKDKE